MEKEWYKWPYGNEMDQEETIRSDVLVLGGGLSGCFAAIAAARRGLSVTLVEKGAAERSGSAGTGFDHWESACTNPCSQVTPEEIAEAYVNEQDWYSNGIAHYIECREGYDRLLDLESFGGKVRDTEDEFKGAEFRDDETKLMFAYDYKNKFTIRVWGSTFKPALAKEMRRLGVRVMDRTEATALLMENTSGVGNDSGEDAKQDVSEQTAGENASGWNKNRNMPEQTKEKVSGCAAKRSGQEQISKVGGNGNNLQQDTEKRDSGKTEKGNPRCAGALGMNVHTGKFYIFRAKSTVLAMSRPARVWLFNADMAGLCEFRPFQSIGSGHAMGWRVGVEFTMMEKSVRAEFSAAGRSFPPYGAGNNHNTWYAATMVDARGVEIPYVNRDGVELKTVSERYYPAPGQKFFLKGGVIDNPKYEYRGPETLDFEELMKRGYQLPFYADLSRMPEPERRVIWGMMIGEEAKTKVPIYQNYTERGFDPEKHMLQSYGTGWQSANFLEQERQFFGAPGGVMHDWDLKTNIDGLYAAGDQLYASDCAGFACATGYYAGRKAADYAAAADFAETDRGQIDAEKERLYAPLFAEKEDGISWKELNMAISKAMQNYCGGVKCEALLKEGLNLLESFEKEIVPKLTAANPHELMRVHEVLDILTVAQIVLHASLARKSSSAPLCFQRSDYPEMDPPCDRKHIVIRQENGCVRTREVPLDFFGDLKAEYEKRNQDYIAELRQKTEEGNCVKSAVVEIKESSAGKDTSAKDVDIDDVKGRYKEKENGSDEAAVQQETAKNSSQGNFFEEKRKKTEESCLECSPRIRHIKFEAAPVPCSTNPLKYDEKLCIGCNRCAAVCQCDILLPSPEKGKHPVIMYPGECYYCGACVMVCPKPGAIRLSHPLMNRAKFVPVKR